MTSRLRKSAFGLATVVGCLEVWALAMVLAVTGCSSATPSTPSSPTPAVSKSASPKPKPSKSTPKTDPKFSTCAKAKAAGYGPYHKGDPEFSWYRDNDGDGVVCE